MPESTSSPTNSKANPLFRDQALRKLKTPDRLDDLVVVVPPLGWLSLWAIVAALLGALAWGIFGRIPKTVDGEGILLRGGRITSIVAAGGGEVRALHVEVGDRVEEGDIVTTIEQPVLRNQIETQTLRVRQLKQRLQEVEAQSQGTLDSQLTFSRDQRAKINTSISDYTSQIASLQKVVDAQEQLLKQGLIPLTTLLQSRTQLDTTQINLIGARGQLQQLETNDDTARTNAAQAIFQARSSYETEHDLLERYEVEFQENGLVRTVHSGTVVGINTSIGNAVTAGARVIDLERDDLPMSAVIFFPAGPGKRIRSGMTAQIAPETTPVERFGFIVGTVDEIAAIPATKGSMMTLLANEEVVSSILANGPVIEVQAVLFTDPHATSGYRWSSSKGPPFSIPAGTISKGRVVIAEDRPIELVIPFLKKFFGIVD